MRTVKNIFPLILETSHFNLILSKFIFINISKETITEANLIESLDAEIMTYLERLTGVDLSETTDENKQTMFNLVSNLLLLSNLDYNDNFNIRMRGLEKWLKIISELTITDPTKLYYNVVVNFRGLTSPQFVFKKLTTPIKNSDLRLTSSCSFQTWTTMTTK